MVLFVLVVVDIGCDVFVEHEVAEAVTEAEPGLGVGVLEAELWFAVEVGGLFV